MGNSGRYPGAGGLRWGWENGRRSVAALEWPVVHHPQQQSRLPDRSAVGNQRRCAGPEAHWAVTHSKARFWLWGADMENLKLRKPTSLRILVGMLISAALVGFHVTGKNADMLIRTNFDPQLRRALSTDSGIAGATQPQDALAKPSWKAADWATHS